VGKVVENSSHANTELFMVTKPLPQASCLRAATATTVIPLESNQAVCPPLPLVACEVTLHEAWIHSGPQTVMPRIPRTGRKTLPVVRVLLLQQLAQRWGSLTILTILPNNLANPHHQLETSLHLSKSRSRSLHRLAVAWARLAAGLCSSNKLKIPDSTSEPQVHCHLHTIMASVPMNKTTTSTSAPDPLTRTTTPKKILDLPRGWVPGALAAVYGVPTKSAQLQFGDDD